MNAIEKITKGLEKKRDELATLRERLQDVQVWLESAAFMQNQDLFISSVKQRDELQRRELELKAQVPLLEWVLKILGTNKSLDS